VTRDGRKLITHHSSPITFYASGLVLRRAGDLVTGFALAALFKERGAFETLEDIALAAQSGGRAEAGML